MSDESSRMCIGISAGVAAEGKQRPHLVLLSPFSYNTSSGHTQGAALSQVIPPCPIYHFHSAHGVCVLQGSSSTPRSTCKSSAMKLSYFVA